MSTLILQYYFVLSKYVALALSLLHHFRCCEFYTGKQSYLPFESNLMATHKFYAPGFCLIFPLALLGAPNYPLTETSLKTWPQQTIIFARYIAKMFYAHQLPVNRWFATWQMALCTRPLFDSQAYVFCTPFSNFNPTKFFFYDKFVMLQFRPNMITKSEYFGCICIQEKSKHTDTGKVRLGKQGFAQFM